MKLARELEAEAKNLARGLEAEVMSLALEVRGGTPVSPNVEAAIDS